MHINRPTRITQHTSTVLDQCLTNFSNFVKSAGTLPPLGNNDHCTIYVNLLFKTNKPASFERTLWDFKNSDFSIYAKKLSEIPWDNYFENAVTINDTCEKLTESILDTAKLYIKNKNAVIRPNDKPFYNGYLRRLKRKINRLFKKAKSQNSTIQWDNYKHERNFYFREVNRCKLEYFNKKYDLLNNEVLNPKSYFKLAKSTFGFTCNSSNVIPPLFSGNGHILTNDLDKASAFNNFFAEASNLNDSNASVPADTSVLPGISKHCYNRAGGK